MLPKHTIRRACPGDQQALAALERNHGTEPRWEREHFARFVERKQTRYLALLAETESGELLGSLLTQNRGSYQRMLAMTVHSNYRRQGLGRALLRDAINRIATPARRVFVASCREHNLGFQLWARAMHFDLLRVVKGGYADPCEDAYELIRRSVLLQPSTPPLEITR